MDIALTAFPSLAPPIELSFSQRLTRRDHPSLEIVPDVAAINADFFRQFKSSFIAAGSMKRMDGPDRRHYVSFHGEAAQSSSSRRGSPRIFLLTFKIRAALALAA